MRDAGLGLGQKLKEDWEDEGKKQKEDKKGGDIPSSSTTATAARTAVRMRSHTHACIMNDYRQIHNFVVTFINRFI